MNDPRPREWPKKRPMMRPKNRPMNRPMNRRPAAHRLFRPALGLIAACLVCAALLWPAAAAEVVYPLASRLGLVPPAGMRPATTFPGFENQEKNVFVRLVALPGPAFAEIEKTMTVDALKKQGMTIEKRESVTLPNGNAILVVASQMANAARIRKWLLIAPINGLTALVSFETLAKTPAPYADAAIRAALLSVAARPTVPADEQLALVPFKVSDMAGLRLVQVVPGVAAQFTDGTKDTLDTLDQPHLVIAAAAGGPRQASDRDHFARLALTGLPPLKDVRVTNSEPMRIGGQSGHELRAQGKDPQTGAEVEIVQWLRFGTGAYLRILGLGPKQNWTQTFMRFRAVRDGLEPR